MPYYSAKQPEKARLSVAEGKQTAHASGTRFLTNDRRLHFYQDDRIIIRKPRLDRIMAGSFSKGLTIISLWVGGSLVAFGLHCSWSNPASEFIFSLAAISLWLQAGPDDLGVDLRQRTYQYRRGLLYLAPTLTGTLSDISTVGVQRTNSDLRHLLVLIWNVPGRRPTHLGEFRTLEQAREQRALLLDRLAL